MGAVEIIAVISRGQVQRRIFAYARTVAGTWELREFGYDVRFPMELPRAIALLAA